MHKKTILVWVGDLTNFVDQIQEWYEADSQLPTIFESINWQFLEQSYSYKEEETSKEKRLELCQLWIIICSFLFEKVTW